MTIADQLTSDELRRVADRQRWSMRVLSERVGSLVLENIELMSIIQELQADLAKCRAGANLDSLDNMAAFADDMLAPE